MVLSQKLSRSIRAREDSDSEPHSSEIDVSSPSVLATGDGGDADDIDNNGAFEGGSDDFEGFDEEEEYYENEEGVEEELDSDKDSDEEPENTKSDTHRLAKVSFGELAKAQDSLTSKGTKRKRNNQIGVDAQERDEKLAALKERLQELKALKSNKATSKPGSVSTNTQKKRKISKPSSDDSTDFGSSGDDSENDSDTNKGRSKRRNKHAPAIQSTTHPVPRMRPAVSPPRKSRDPRFDRVSAGTGKDEGTTRARYAFLDQYRASELATKKAEMAKTKDTGEKERLKKDIEAMEARERAREASERERTVRRKIRKEEREAVKQGKKPFYAKESEIKKRVQMERFKSMNAKQRDKAVQKRRKKEAQREKKAMPNARRTR